METIKNKIIWMIPKIIYYTTRRKENAFRKKNVIFNCNIFGLNIKYEYKKYNFPIKENKIIFYLIILFIIYKIIKN
jgi:hypothetical protein